MAFPLRAWKYPESLLLWLFGPDEGSEKFLKYYPFDQMWSIPEG
jgi:hypothetical protein